MMEWRKDPVIGQWVIVRTTDSWGPDQYEQEDHYLRQAPTCQFCPGKEYFTPPEVDAIRSSGSHPNGKGWSVRVVPNKFPALRIEGNLDERRDGIFSLSNGIGAHEVVIETPEHHTHLADFSETQMIHLIHIYQRRLVDLSRDRRFKYIIIFKNYGESAGTTIEHPHSQIIALPLIPKYVLEKMNGAHQYDTRNNRCVYCDMVEQEFRDQERIVAQNDDFLAFCPFVSRYPFECWIFPKRHCCEFARMDDRERQSLGNILRETLRRVKICLSDPSYNYYVHSSPVNDEIKGSFHWHIEIVPKLTHAGGLEWGAGFHIVPTDPRMAAQYLRSLRPVSD